MKSMDADVAYLLALVAYLRADENVSDGDALEQIYTAHDHISVGIMAQPEIQIQLFDIDRTRHEED